MRSFKRSKVARGFTLVELMIVVAIIGVLAALAIYGVRKYLANAKSAEARNSIGAIARGAQAAWTRENAPSQIVAVGQASAAASQALCGGGGTPASGPVPAAIVSVKGTKYQPDQTNGKDYATGNQTNGWRCLRFELTTAQYYQYNYTGGANAIASIAPGTATGMPVTAGSPIAFAAEATGDLNGDGTQSYFQLGGQVNAANNQLVIATQVFESLPDE